MRKREAQLQYGHMAVQPLPHQLSRPRARGWGGGKQTDMDSFAIG